MNSLRQYRINIGVVKTTTVSLMDSGANGGMAGDDVLITAYHDHDRAQVLREIALLICALLLRQVLLSPRKDQ